MAFQNRQTEVSFVFILFYGATKLAAKKCDYAFVEKVHAATVGIAGHDAFVRL